MKKCFTVIFALVLLIALSSFSFAQDNKLAIFMIDSDLGTAGLQGGTSVTGIGGGQNVGLAIYLKNVDQFNAVKVEFEWDGTKAAYGAKSGTAIASETLTINGKETALAAETCLLTSPLGLGEVNQAGNYVNNYAMLGGSASSADYGFVYLLVLQTDASFTTTDSFEVQATITIANAGVEKFLGTRRFYVNGVTDVKPSTWGEVKSQFKD